MFGDKTMLAVPSAFDRINVRRLFLTLEDTIERAARAQCKECRKPFPGIFRKKRYQANSLGDLTRDYYCDDCFLALPKNEKLDEPGDVSDPWAW